MPRPKSDRREEIAAVAAGVTYQQGFRATTLAEVAQHAKVPVGSVYYYFKTKEEMGSAVVGTLAARYAELRDGWDAAGDPRDALQAFVRMTVDNAGSLARFGCPIGSLASELGKQDAELAAELADIFRQTLAWVAARFVALGCDKETAEAHALQLLSALEGASLLAHMFTSHAPVEREGARLLDWLQSFGAPPIGKEP